jgi:cell division transport system permease protein
MGKLLNTAINRISRSPYQTLAAVSIMTMTLFLFSILFLLSAGSQAVLNYFETRPQINAFFKSEYIPPQTDIDRIESQLRSTGLMKSFKYVTKEAALVIYKDLNKSDPLLLEAVTASMLPASLEVTANKPADLPKLADQLKLESQIDDVRYAQDIVGTLTRWTNSVRIIGIALVGTNVLITFVIILLIIGVKVASRREEIVILQLVGATRGYISAPFVYEGIIYGLIGAVIAWGVTYLILLYSMPFLVSFLAGIPILPPPILFMFELLGGEMLLGALVGGFGGFIATRRYLKT